MHLNLVNGLGLTAEFLIIIAQIPQIFKSFKTKRTDDISMTMLLSVLAGLCLWVIYGLLKPDPIIVISNLISVAAFSFVIYAKIKFTKK